MMTPAQQAALERMQRLNAERKAAAQAAAAAPAAPLEPAVQTADRRLTDGSQTANEPHPADCDCDWCEEARAEVSRALNEAYLSNDWEPWCPVCTRRKDDCECAR